jgi:hypothetical protein
MLAGDKRTALESLRAQEKPKQPNNWPTMEKSEMKKLEKAALEGQ